MKTRLFLDLPRISHLCIMSQRRTNQLSSSLHHDSAICSDSVTPEIIECYNKTKGALDMLDEMCARYTVQRETRNVLWHDRHCCSDQVRKDQPEKIKRKDFLLRIVHDLVTPFVTQRYKLPTLPRNIKTAIVMCGLISDSEENTAGP